MIDFNQASITFKKYLQDYDLEYGKIELKIRHTYGVVNASEYIAKELSLDDENIIDNSSKEILENDVISENIFNDFMNNKVIRREDRKTYMDFLVSSIAFIFDFNFNTGLEYIQKMNYIDTIINRLDYKNIDTKQKMEKIRKHAIQYLEGRLKN